MLRDNRGGVSFTFAIAVAGLVLLLLGLTSVGALGKRYTGASLVGVVDAGKGDARKYLASGYLGIYRVKGVPGEFAVYSDSAGFPEDAAITVPLPWLKVDGKVPAVFMGAIGIFISALLIIAGTVMALISLTEYVGIKKLETEELNRTVRLDEIGDGGIITRRR